MLTCDAELRPVAVWILMTTKRPPSDSSTAAIIPDPVHAELRSAVNIKNALHRIRRLPQLGYCPTKTQAFCHKFQLHDEDTSRGFLNKERPETRFRTRDFTNQVCKYVVQVYRVHPLTVSFILDRPSLMVSRACARI